MTREESIVILQESLRQNKIIQKSPNTFFRSADIADGVKNAERRITALNMAIAALRAEQDTPPNGPLTLEQLREMDGEPVWVIWAGHPQTGWALVRVWSKPKNAIYLAYNNGINDIAEFVLNDGGRIYRRKPEEGTA